MKFLLIFYFNLLALEAFCQKASITLNDLGTWPQITFNASLSSNGRYAHYIYNEPSTATGFSVVVNTSGRSRYVFKSEIDLGFTQDSKYFLFVRGDSIFRYDNSAHAIKYLSRGNSVQLLHKKSDDFLLFKGDGGIVRLYNIRSSHAIEWYDVKDFTYDYFAEKIRLYHRNRNGASIITYNLISGTSDTIWTGSFDQRLISWTDPNRNVALAFLVASNNKHTSLWIVNKDDKQAKKVSNEDSLGGLQFTSDARYLFIRKALPSVEHPHTLKTKVTIWSYNDLDLQPQQQINAEENYQWLVFSSRTGKHIILDKEYKLMSQPNDIKGDYVIARKGAFVIDSTRPSVSWIITLNDGSSKLFKANDKYTPSYNYSLDGKCVVYYDPDSTAFIKYDFLKGSNENLLKNIPDEFTNNKFTVVPFPYSDKIHWFPGGQSFYLYSRYDIWQVFLNIKTAPKNITNGFGKRHNLSLRLADLSESDTTVSLKSGALLVAFNRETKQNGFYSLNKLGQNPKLLTMGDYTYYLEHSQFDSFEAFSTGLKPTGSQLTGWVISRESATEMPNYYYTKNFKRFQPLSNINNNCAYRWLTAKQIQFHLPDGKIGCGILYMPEHLDSTSSYPVLINYYEELSQRLNNFPYPYFSYNNINIPWFVANGYLVFTPDIYAENANTSNKTIGEWAKLSVESATEELCKLSFVNSKKIGLQGHSFGGMETAFIATHSDKFAAVAEFAGSTDPISRYLTLVPFLSPVEHFSNSDGMETNHELYGATLWERPDLYLRNSAVLAAKNVTAPILITHNDADNQVQWRQGVEFYMALRRLKKVCWMLQYDGKRHSLFQNDAKDYTIRLTQFFDHYLKGTPAPVWMTKGIPAKLKGIETGYELDPDVEP